MRLDGAVRGDMPSVSLAAALAIAVAGTTLIGTSVAGAMLGAHDTARPFYFSSRGIALRF